MLKFFSNGRNKQQILHITYNDYVNYTITLRQEIYERIFKTDSVLLITNVGEFLPERNVHFVRRWNYSYVSLCVRQVELMKYFGTVIGITIFNRHYGQMNY